MGITMKEEINSRKIFFYKAILFTFGIVISITVFCMLFLKWILPCPVMNRTLGNNVFYFFAAFIGSFAGYVLLKKVWKAEAGLDKKKIMIGMVAASAFVYVVQLIIIRHIWFETGWDVTCVYHDAVHRAEDGTLLGAHEYFTTSPNNIMLTFAFSIICRILYLAGITGYYPVLCCIGALLINTSGFLVFLIVCRLTGSVKTALITWGIYTALIGLSPWMCVPYSDVYAIWFPVVIFYLYLAEPERMWGKAAKWAGIGFLTKFGYEIKPTVSIITIAMVLILLVHLLEKPDRRKTASGLLLLGAGCLLGVAFSVYAEKYMGFLPDRDKDLPVAHYLMLGQNGDTYGVFSGADRSFTLQFATKEEKIKNDLRVAKERVISRGIGGNIRFFLIKNMVNYDNGTFSWAYEGEFFKDVSVREDSVSLFLRDIYYPEGKYHRIYSTVCQGIWILMLAGCVGIVIDRNRAGFALPALAILGLTLFLLLFEARARYLFLYTPLYVLSGGVGLKNLYSGFIAKIQCFMSRERHG